jgi:hypothetical protein
LGGDALRVFGAPGITTVLGYVHMGLGFLALPVGYVMLSAVATARRLAFYLNIVMIAYSLATEGIVESIGSLAPAYFLESMVGTLVAVAINLAIMVLLAASARASRKAAEKQVGHQPTPDYREHKGQEIYQERLFEADLSQL